MDVPCKPDVIASSVLTFMPSEICSIAAKCRFFPLEIELHKADFGNLGTYSTSSPLIGRTVAESFVDFIRLWPESSCRKPVVHSQTSN